MLFEALSCEIMTPFGVPVVPDVYCKYAMVLSWIEVVFDVVRIDSVLMILIGRLVLLVIGL